MAGPIISTKRIKIEKSKRTMFLAAAGAAVIVSFSLVITKFLWDLSQFNNQVISAKTSVRDSLEDNIRNAEELTQSFATFEDDSDGITSQTVLDALPSKYDFPALVTSLEGLASRSGMTVKSIDGDDLGDSALNVSPKPVPEMIPISMSVEGQYDDLRVFLENLQLSIRPMSVERLDLRGSDELISANMRIETYYQPAVDLEVQTEKLLGLYPYFSELMAFVGGVDD